MRLLLLFLVLTFSYAQNYIFEVVENTGIDFINHLEADSLINPFTDYYFYSSAGVGIGDLNNDGLPDVVFTSGQQGGRIYQNLGNFKFKDVTPRSGAFKNDSVWRDGVALVDVNGDGLLDIYVSTRNNKPNELYINLGNFTFIEQAESYGIEQKGNSLQANFFDYDKDGDLDLYLINVGNVKTFKGHYKAVQDRFFVNKDGKFRDETFQMFFEWQNEIRTNGLSVLAFDFDNDNSQEIYVANDFEDPDYYYNFISKNKVENIAYKVFKQTPLYAMGSDAQDINNDGFLDIVVADMAPEDPVRSKKLMSGMNPGKFWRIVEKYKSHQYMYNALQLNNRNETFSNINFYAHIPKTDWSWSPLIFDFDNDGKKDIFISNGIRKDLTDNDFFKITKDSILKIFNKPSEYDLTNEELKIFLKALPEQPLENYFFLQKEPFKFRKIPEKIKHKPSYSVGAAYADLDNDGDLDLIVNNIDDFPFVYKNNSQELFNNNFVKVFLKDKNSKNTFCIGTKLWLITDKNIYFTEINPVRGYESSSDYPVIFGIGKENPVKLVIQWHNGNIKEYKVEANKLNIITTKTPGKNSVIPIKYEKDKYFYDATDKIKPEYIHKENAFDDYKIQVLLPHKMSEFGPALAVADVNNDGLEDFFVGAAKGYAPALYIQTSEKTFVRKSIPDFEKTKEYEDIDAVFVDIDNDGDKDLYVVSGGYEQDNEQLYKDRVYINDKGIFHYVPTKTPDIYISGGCVVPADIDNDGDTDLFVGGRQRPKHYPFPTDSYILENQNGKFTVKQTFKNIGMIATACFIDIDNDKDLDLITAGEWTPVSIFKNDNGNFTKFKDLQNTNGWWNNIQLADLDNDGDLDIIATNLGLNHKYHASPEHPFHVYSEDYDKNNKTDIVLAYEYKDKQLPVRGRECSSQQIPVIKEKFPTYSAFASSTVFDIYGEPLQKSLHLITNNFANIVLENQGNGNFVQHLLPPEAQFATTFGINVMDVNNDSKKDIILFGNFYCFEVETPRSDASQGLLLLNNGNFDFTTVWASEAGIFNPNDARKSKIINVSGTPAILVPNNQQKLKLFIKK